MDGMDEMDGMDGMDWVDEMDSWMVDGGRCWRRGALACAGLPPPIRSRAGAARE